jgi:hypothetical protein
MGETARRQRQAPFYKGSQEKLKKKVSKFKNQNKSFKVDKLLYLQYPIDSRVTNLKKLFHSLVHYCDLFYMVNEVNFITDRTMPPRSLEDDNKICPDNRRHPWSVCL